MLEDKCLNGTLKCLFKKRERKGGGRGREKEGKK